MNSKVDINIEREVCGIIENALDLEAGSISIEDSKKTIEQWDSLGVLSILGALEEKYGNEITSINDLPSAESVKDIVEILKSHKII